MPLQVFPNDLRLLGGRLALWTLAMLVTVPATLVAAETPQVDNAEGLALFENKIRPLLAQHCYQCHSTKTGRTEGSLRLDSRQGIRIGGDRGPAIVPGKPEESLLLTAISHTDPDLMMPPRQKQLPKSSIADVKKWIQLGAPDPRDATTEIPARPPVDLVAGRKFWSFQKPVARPIPEVKRPGWAKRPLDHFIMARLEAAGLAPSPDATPATLLRRLHFDLVGLPPAPAAIDDFQGQIKSAGIDEALQTEVDRLLASQQFGERWGRHWLDVARFAESSGKEANISYPYAWRYRNYVIDSFNADTPFDRMLVEQIAGDQLPYDNQHERARLLIATGFLAVGPKNLDEASAAQFRADLVDEQIDTVTRAVMANSVACARCHDHKFDPFAMEDYYALAGVFSSTKTYFGTFVSPANRVGGDPLVLPRLDDLAIFHAAIPQQKVQQLQQELAALKKEQTDGMLAVRKAVEKGEDPSEIFTLRDALRIFWRSGAIEGQLEKVDEAGQPLPLAMGVLDQEKIVDAPLLARGEIGNPGATVPRGFPRVIELEGTHDIPQDSSGRLEFAKWLTHPDHPLTSRVITNRVWNYLFGAGIVGSVDNFGFHGERPSHPELLDQLTVTFVDNGWSIKQLVREIVLSRTYRQSSTFRTAAFQRDPENRLLWRVSKRRLDAECIRDAMLAVAGELDYSRPDGSLVAQTIGDRPISLIGLDKRIPKDLDDSLHRSVYLPVLRDRLPDVLDLFDFAEPSLVTGSRETTNVPIQALYLMNSPFVQERSAGLAHHLRKIGKDDRQHIHDAFVLCFARTPDPEEQAIGAAFLRRGRQLAGEDPAIRRKVLVNYCQALLSTAEFRNID